MGILYRNEYAETVLRVRNCEEVVYVPPKGYLNPGTGDAGITRAGAAMLVSFGCLLLTGRRKKK